MGKERRYKDTFGGHEEVFFAKILTKVIALHDLVKILPKAVDINNFRTVPEKGLGLGRIDIDYLKHS